MKIKTWPLFSLLFAVAIAFPIKDSSSVVAQDSSLKSSVPRATKIPCPVPPDPEEIEGKTIIREIICDEQRALRYWQITTDKEDVPKNTTWYVMSKYPDITPRDVGNFYGLRTWVEYGLKQSKNELGWADFRLTHYP